MRRKGCSKFERTWAVSRSASASARMPARWALYPELLRVLWSSTGTAGDKRRGIGEGCEGKLNIEAGGGPAGWRSRPFAPRIAPRGLRRRTEHSQSHSRDAPERQGRTDDASGVRWNALHNPSTAIAGKVDDCRSVGAPSLDEGPGWVHGVSVMRFR